MHLVEPTEKSFDYLHPREAFLRLFPVEKPCATCGARVMLDGYEDTLHRKTDVVYRKTEGYEWLAWECPMCHHETTFHIGDGAEKQMYLRGYRELVPNWWRDYGVLVFAMVVVLLMSLIPFIEFFT